MNPSEPRRAIVDTHVHIASPDTEHYPRRPLGGGGTTWWHDDPLTAERLLVGMDASGVERAVIVHAFGPYSFDCRYTIYGAAVDPHRLRAVVAADLAAPDAEMTISRYAAHPLVRGVRLFAARDEDAAWLREPAATRVWDACASAGMHVVVVALADHVAAVEPLLRHRDDVVTVIDHCALPEVRDGRIVDASTIFRFADLAHVHFKVTTPLLLRAARDGSAQPVVDQLVATFGIERLQWGSDLPQTTGLDYAAMVALAHDATASLSPADRARFLSDNARAMWFDS